MSMFLTALEALVACAVFAVGIALLVLIAKQKREIKTKDRAIETKDRVIETKDRVIETKDRVIETKDREM
jgi:cadmium resistance protein CadD (predicted permease)